MILTFKKTQSLVKSDIFCVQFSVCLCFHFLIAEGGMLREQDRFLPIANIAKIMKKAIPNSSQGKIAKDAVRFLDALDHHSSIP